MGRIFLSYHGHDEGNDIALYLRDSLLAAGYEDVHGYTAPGSGPDVSFPWMDSLRRELLGADALIVITSPGSFSEWCIWEASVFRELKPHSPCIEFFSDRSQHRAILNDLQAQRVDAADVTSMEAARDTALLALERADVSKSAPLTSPFPGLKAFDEHQASIFFGREDDIERLAAPLLGRRAFGALAVIGPSGAGKSSLVRAGLIPLLRREGWTIIGPLTPASGKLPPVEGPGRRLIVLDQAEELLISADNRLSPESAALVRRLVAASRNEAWVVYTVRADFLDELMRHADFEPLLRDDFLVTPLTKAELPVVVNGPLRSLGWSVADAALGLIQEDASHESLPLLAFALESLWRHVNPDGLRPPRPITRAEYVASGRVMDVLRRQAEEAFAMARDQARDEDGAWPPVRDAERQVLCTLRQLVAVDRSGKFTSRTVPVTELSAQERRLLAPFIANRVVTADQETLKVAHESLFMHWPRLREGLERDRVALRARREVEDIAAEWVKHPDQLIAPSRLAALLAVLAPADDTFTELWSHLEDTLIALHFSEDAVRLFQSSLQRWADGEVRKATAMNPDDTLRMLAGDEARLLLHAPDLSGWKQSLLRAMASTHRLWALTGHSAGVRGIDWSPDDTMLVTGSKDGTVRVWDAETGAGLRVFRHSRQHHSNGPPRVCSVAWSPNSDLVASIATDETLRLWSAGDGRELRVIPLPAHPRSVRFDAYGERVLVACADGSAYVWEVGNHDGHPDGQVVSVDGERRAVGLWDADFSADGRRIATARDDGRIDVHTPTSSWVESLSPADLATSAVRSVRFHPHLPTVIVSGTQDAEVVLEVSSRRRRLRGHVDRVRKVSWSPLGSRIATASADGSVRVWDLTTEAEVLRLPHQQDVRDVEWSHAGDRLASAADDGTLRMWKVGSEPALGSTIKLEHPVRSLAWNPLHEELTVGHQSVEERVFTAIGHVSRRGRLNTPHLGRPESVAWASDGQMLAVGFSDGFVSLTTETGHEVVRLPQAADRIHDAQWSADGSLLAVVSRDRRWLPRVYRRDGKLLEASDLTRHSGPLRAVAWHPDREIFAVAGEDGLITVNSVDSTLYSHCGSCGFTSVAWHPHDDLLVAGCTDSTIRLLHMDGELTEIRVLHGHRDEINAVAWSPDGSCLLSASEDHTARVWNPETGGQRTALIGHTGAVTAALWSPDGLAITGSGDTTVRCWDTSDGSVRPLSGNLNSNGVAELIAEARMRIS